jgi:hypothetical protein
LEEHMNPDVTPFGISVDVSVSLKKYLENRYNKHVIWTKQNRREPEYNRCCWRFDYNMWQKVNTQKRKFLIYLFTIILIWIRKFYCLIWISHMICVHKFILSTAKCTLCTVLFTVIIPLYSAYTIIEIREPV